MRGVISLAIAFGLPTGFPGRELIVFLTFCVILSTLVFQGLTLPPLIRWLGLKNDGREAREEAAARLHAADAALETIEQSKHKAEPPPERILESLQRLYERRRAYAAAVVEADDPQAKPACHSADDPFRGVFALRHEIIHAERCVLLEMHRKGEIHDNVLHHLERELDLEEQRARHER